MSGRSPNWRAFTAAIKILGIAALAIAGIAAAGLSSFGNILGAGSTTQSSGEGQGLLGFLAGTTLCVLAYKGFTTITNRAVEEMAVGVLDYREPGAWPIASVVEFNGVGVM